MKNRLLEMTRADNISDRDLLIILLTFSIKQNEAEIVADRLLAEFGTAENVFSASKEDLMEKCELSMSTVMLIRLVCTISSRFHKS